MEEAEAPRRIEQVMEKARAFAEKHGANRQVVEAVYRTMIARFIEYEMDERDGSRER